MTKLSFLHCIWPVFDHEQAVVFALNSCFLVFCTVVDDRLAFEYSGAGLMTFAELSEISFFPTLTIDHMSRWSDLEKKLLIWKELDLNLTCPLIWQHGR
jgi:cytochrome bd-type quinol oxidase subunit 2